MSRIRGSILPPEWDITSSKVTVYHRTNIVEIATGDGHVEYEYDEEQMTFDKFEELLKTEAIHNDIDWLNTILENVVQKLDNAGLLGG